MRPRMLRPSSMPPGFNSRPMIRGFYAFRAVSCRFMPVAMARVCTRWVRRFKGQG